MHLSAPAVRVLGCLVEKQLTVPDTYPLTLNALVTACNQSTSRNPVVAYSDADVIAALDELRTVHRLARVVHSGAGSRVDKYRQVADERLALSLPELALLAVLALRGAQTVAELKARTERMHAFADLDAVETVLRRLADPAALADPEEPTTRTDTGALRSTAPTVEIPDGQARPWDGALVVRLPRAPGQKEERWMHQLTGAVDVADAALVAQLTAGAAPAAGGAPTRSAALEQEIAELRAGLAALRAEHDVLAAAFDTFRAQF